MNSRTVTEMTREVLQKQILLSMKYNSGRIRNLTSIETSLGEYRERKGFPPVSRDTVRRILRSLILTGEITQGIRPRPHGWEYWYQVKR